MTEMQAKLLDLIEKNGDCIGISCHADECPIIKDCKHLKDFGDVREKAIEIYLKYFTEASLVEHLL